MESSERFDNPCELVNFVNLLRGTAAFFLKNGVRDRINGKMAKNLRKYPPYPPFNVHKVHKFTHLYEYFDKYSDWGEIIMNIFINICELVNLCELSGGEVNKLENFQKQGFWRGEGCFWRLLFLALKTGVSSHKFTSSRVVRQLGSMGS